MYLPLCFHRTPCAQRFATPCLCALRAAFVADRNCQFIEERAGQTFFLWSGFYSPHSPWIAPKSCVHLYDLDAMPLPDRTDNEPWVREAEGLSDDQLRAIKAHYYAMVADVDRCALPDLLARSRSRRRSGHRDGGGRGRGGDAARLRRSRCRAAAPGRIAARCRRERGGRTRVILRRTCGAGPKATGMRTQPRVVLFKRHRRARTPLRSGAGPWRTFQRRAG